MYFIKLYDPVLQTVHTKEVHSLKAVFEYAKPYLEAGCMGSWHNMDTPLKIHSFDEF